MNYKLEDKGKLDLVAGMVVVNVKHVFSEEENEQNAQMLAQGVNDKSYQESEKKMVMAQYKEKIDTIQGKINQLANYLTAKFMMVDKPAEMYRDYARAKRVYFDKATGDFLSEENFHASDYQKKLDFEEREEQRLQEDIERNLQIEENNRIGDQAEGVTDALDEVITNKKLQVVAADDDLPGDDQLFKDIK